MSQYPVSACVLFVLLFDMFILSRKIALVDMQILGKMGPKNMPNVPQEIGPHERQTIFQPGKGDQSFSFRRETKGSKMEGKMGILAAALGGPNEHQFSPCRRELYM